MNKTVVLVVIVIVVMAMVLCGCGDDDTSSTSEPTPTIPSASLIEIADETRDALEEGQSRVCKLCLAVETAANCTGVCR